MSEHSLHSKDFAQSGIMELLGEMNLLGFVSKLRPFVTQIVLEFYVNLSKDMEYPANPNFQRTVVWGHTFSFFPSIINQYWECKDIP